MIRNIRELVKPFIPTAYWNKKRLESIVKQHKQTADFWHPIIETYFAGAIEKYSLKPKKELTNQKVIWQYWGQGIDSGDLPEIIQLCFRSVDKYKDNYQVVRLTDATISDYIDLPDFVLEKEKGSPFTRTFFSDLLRLALLSTYGGIWLDATIFLTGTLPLKWQNLDFFMYQRSEDEQNREYWESAYAYYFGWDCNFRVRMLSSIIFAKKDSQVIAVLLDLMLFFWKTQEQIPNYFCLQILFNELINNELSDNNCPIDNDCIPHLLQTKINGSYQFVSYDEVLRLTNIHKMAYFDAAAMKRFKALQLI